MRQQEWARLLREYHTAKVAADAAKAKADELKAAMTAAGLTRVEAGGFIATLTTVNGTRFDSKAFKADHEDLYSQYTVPSPTTRLNLK